MDAFPASDGYPIFESGVYDENHPYVNRDPRFERFIFLMEINTMIHIFEFMKEVLIHPADSQRREPERATI